MSCSVRARPNSRCKTWARLTTEDEPEVQLARATSISPQTMEGENRKPRNLEHQTPQHDLTEIRTNRGTENDERVLPGSTFSIRRRSAAILKAATAAAAKTFLLNFPSRFRRLPIATLDVYPTHAGISSSNSPPSCTKGQSQSLAKRSLILCSVIFPLNAIFPWSWK